MNILNTLQSDLKVSPSSRLDDPGCALFTQAQSHK